MINVCDALGWIEGYRPCPIHHDDVVTAKRMLNRRLAIDARQGYADQLEIMETHYVVPAARGFIRVHLGIFQMDRGNCEGAVAHFSNAAEWYHGLRDVHCLAAVLWLMGMAQRAMGLHHLAFERSKESRDLFMDLHAEAARMRRNDTALGQQWYNQRILSMTADLLRTPRDAFEWTYTGVDAPRKQFLPAMTGTPGAGSSVPKPSVNRYRRTYDGSETLFRPSAQLVRNQIDNLLEMRVYDRIPALYGTLNDLNQVSPGKECCEMHLYSAALAASLPNLRRDALYHLETARATCQPNSRAKMITLWMLGLMLFEDPARRCDAVRHMETSISCAKKLETQADRDNEPQRRQWYCWNAQAMRSVLDERIRGAF